MFSFFMALLGYLTARLVWDYIQTMAKKQGVMPIRWAAEVIGCLLAFAAIATVFGFAILYVISRSH